MVPATGRSVKNIPPELLSLAFLHYVIAINGAAVYNKEKDEPLLRVELSEKEAAEIFNFCREIPALCTCYQNGEPLMDASDRDFLPRYATDAHILEHLKCSYHPVPSMVESVLAKGPVQKIQLFFADLQLRETVLQQLMECFPEYAVTSSLRNNIEINAGTASKGSALEFLCSYLGIRAENCMAFGDGTNDVSMLSWAGVGVAMENAPSEVRSWSTHMTCSNEDDGVAVFLEQYLAASGSDLRI